MRRRGGETVTVTHQIRAAFRGDVTDGTSFDVPGCSVLPDVIDLETQNFQQDTNVVTFTVIFPTGTDVHPTDKLTVRGIDFDVEGLPVELRSPITGRDAGLQVKAGAITG